LEIRKAIKQQSHYMHAVKLYHDAEKLIAQAYACMDELVNRYEAVKAAAVYA